MRCRVLTAVVYRAATAFRYFKREFPIPFHEYLSIYMTVDKLTRASITVYSSSVLIDPLPTYSWPNGRSRVTYQAPFVIDEKTIARQTPKVLSIVKAPELIKRGRCPCLLVLEYL